MSDNIDQMPDIISRFGTKFQVFPEKYILFIEGGGIVPNNSKIPWNTGITINENFYWKKGTLLIEGVLILQNGQLKDTQNAQEMVSNEEFEKFHTDLFDAYIKKDAERKQQLLWDLINQAKKDGKTISKNQANFIFPFFDTPIPELSSIIFIAKSSNFQ
jgi:hypothetical protein